jgi:hypothetical protein
MILTRRCVPADGRETMRRPSRGFALNRRLTGLFGMSLLAIFVTEAHAIVCSTGFRLIGGSCYKVKGVACEVDLQQLGNVTQHPKQLACNINPPPGQEGVLEGLLFCGNPASNQPPGQVPVLFSCPEGSSSCFGGVTSVDPNAVKRGRTHVQVIALPTADQLNNLAQIHCPNEKFIGLDFVPCAFSSELDLIDVETSDIDEAAKHSCSLPDCSSLTWNKKAHMPEQRDYECVGPLP